MTIHTESQRISGPTELLQAIPYLLGFHPRRSLVVVGLADGVLVVTARLDLDDAVVPGVIRQTVDTLCRGGSTDLIGAVIDDDTEVAALGDHWAGVVGHLERAAADTGCTINDVLAYSAGRWRSVRCASTDCCPPTGRSIPRAPSAFAAAATFAGVVALPDRTALEQLLDPLPDDERAQLRPLLDAAEHEFVGALVSGGSDRLDRSVKRAMFATARQADEAGWDGLDDPTVARYGAALNGRALRDSMWTAIDDGRLNGRGLWRELARRLPSPYDAAPLFLYGWASWRSGDGALAGIAADRAVASDPRYSAADLLQAAVTYGLDPRRTPRLRLPRPA